jgi:hypothetical protein
MPLDPTQLRLAMIAVVHGADALTRLNARIGAGVDAIRAGAQTRDAARLAGKPGASPATVAAARARAKRTLEDAHTSAKLAARATIPPTAMAPNAACIHGRIMDRNGVGIIDAKVHGISLKDELVVQSGTDVRGYFCLMIQAASHSIIPPIAVVVYHCAKVLHRDPVPAKLRPGRARYREIIVTP